MTNEMPSTENVPQDAARDATASWSRLCKCEEMDPITSAAEVRSIIDDVRAGATANVARCQRWMDHLAGRIAYERAQLAEQGAEHLLEPKPRRAGKAAVPLRNVPGGHPMTKAEYAKVWKDYKGTRVVKDNPNDLHRVRVAIVKGALVVVTLTDAPMHEVKPS